MPKHALREELLTRRRSLPAEETLRFSLEAQRRLSATGSFRGARRLALYSPIANEVFTEWLFREAVAGEKLVAYPRVRDRHLEFVQVDSLAQLEQGLFGILEPTGSRIVDVDTLDLAVIPGVAFDRSGHRLGYGRGYYDRAFADRREPVQLVGLCFDFQVVRQLPAEAHDVCMDLVVTDRKIFRCGGVDLPRDS